ncbi:MAG: M48 family metalloprotease [Promethearchaeota archaeon]
MDKVLLNNKGVSLPFSDILLISSYALFYPLFLGLIFIVTSFFIDDVIPFYIILLIVSLILLVIIGIFFYKSYKELRLYATEVSYVQFQPSWRDLVIQMIFQIYYIIFLGLILAAFLGSSMTEFLPQWMILSAALIISLGYQGILVFLSMNSKRKLLATAQHPVKPEIVENVKQFPNSHLISIFRFADIQLASLFLSAGVMTLGWKNICLISQYFNWKLTDEELIAVLGHEEGHLARYHIRTAYLIIGTEGFLRTLRIFCIITGLLLVLNNLPLIALNSSSSLIFLFLFVFIFLTSSCLTIIQRYRVYLQEIRADNYGGNLVGYELLANTLKKLPTLIPAPIGTQQMDFLGFRIALLREQAKHLKQN